MLETPLSPVMVREMVFSPLTNSFPLILKLDTEEAVGQRRGCDFASHEGQAALTCPCGPSIDGVLD